MKKFIKLLIGITILCIMLTACNTNTEQNNNSNLNNENSQGTNQTNQNTQKENEEQEVVIAPLNKDFEMTETLSAMESVITGTNLSKLTEEQIKEKYNFGKYEKLEKLVASNESENSVSEIAMVKLGEAGQNSDILLIFNERKEDLMKKYEDNEEIKNSLTTQDAYIIKEINNVAVMIIGENAKAIEAEFDKAFVK